MGKPGRKFGNQINNHQTVISCDSDSITLPSPDFGDSESFEYTRVNKKSRGGDLIIFRDPNWPKTRVYKKHWPYLSQELRSKFLLFLRNHLGKQLTMVDHEGNTKTVVVRTPDAEFSEPARTLHSVELEFEEV